MFSKRRFRRNKPRSQNFLENGEQQKETPFIPPVQTKLNIGKPGDVYEVEADKTADEVVTKTSSPDAIQKMGAEEEEVQAKPLAQGLTPFVQKQESEKKEEPVQTQAEEEEEPVQAQAEEEEEPVQAQAEEEEEPVQAQEEEEELQAQEEEEELEAKSDNVNQGIPALEKKLKNTNSGGFGLPKPTKKKMEAAFGVDFSKVRIHTGGKADQMNKQLGARAFTHGSDIYFKAGNFIPHSEKGQHLLAHELTHTIQQGAIGAKQPERGNLHNAPSMVQKKDIRYRPLTWADYEITAPSNTPHSVLSGIVIEMKPMEKLVKMGWGSEGDTITVTINYRSSEVEIFAVMKTENSSKEEWITDDETARQKLGHDNIAQAREDILAHEQVHFRNAEVIAQKFNTMAKEAVPKAPYTESFTLPSGEGREQIDRKSAEIAQRKAAEFRQVVTEIKRKATEELDKVQEIYDQNTNHGRETANQKNWEENHDKALEDAIKLANPEQENDESNADD